jgi:hypothetical protein
MDDDYVNFDEEIDTVNQNGENKTSTENAKTG